MATVENITKADVYEPPLDYTFKCLTSVVDCLEEDPRGSTSAASRPRKKSPQRQLSPSGNQNNQEHVPIVKRRTNAVRLSNNVLNEWKDFSSTMSTIVEDPDTAIEWIDLSFNDLTTIDSCLLDYQNLKVLYLHGNAIEKLSEVDKLVNLPVLRSLTLHGNPIEEAKGYRQYVLSRLPQLKNFDFSGVTKSDRACSDTWKQMSKRQKPKLT